MVKSTTAAMDTHLAGEVTTLAQAWKIVRRDGQIFRFTTASEDIDIDIGDGLGAQTYIASVGYQKANSSNDSDMNVANTENKVVFDDVILKEQELRRGLFDFADVYIFYFNHQDTSMGIIKQFRGKLGRVIMTNRKWGDVELRDMLEAFAVEIGEVYSKDCRADLGDHRCRHPLFPPLLLRGDSPPILAAADTDDWDHESTQVYRRVPTNPVAGYLTDLTSDMTNPDFETGTTAGWNIVSGTWASVASFLSLLPQAGGFFLRMTDTSSSATREINQTVELRSGSGGSLDEAKLAAGEYHIVVSCYRANSAASDTGRVILEALDASDVVLATLGDTGSQTIATLNEWSLRTVGGQIPENTAKVRVRLTATRVAGTDNDAAFDSITLSATDLSLAFLHEWTEDKIYKVITTGPTAAVTPVYDTTPGNQTTDGELVVECVEAWTRAIEVVSISEQRRTFKVSELTPNTGGPNGGFPDDWFNAGAVIWETGDNANPNQAYEVRDFVADDGVTIEQTIELIDDSPFDLQVGDKGRIQAGCDKVYGTCISKFANWLNFVGEPFVPTEDVFGKYPDAH